MRYLSLLFLSLVVLAASCGEDDEKATLEVNFKAVYDGQPVVLIDGDYDYVEDMKLKYQLFQFFMTDLSAHEGATASSAADMLTEVELVEFADDFSTEAAEEGVTLTFNELEPKSYEGLSFGMGLTQSLNSTSPADYSASNPLSTNYWSAAGSYIFYKIEGNADTLNNGDFSHKLTYHIGGNPNLREIFLAKNFDLEGGQTTRLVIEVDLKEAFIDGNEFVDVRRTPVNHSGTSNLAGFMTNNLSEAFSIK